MLGATIIILSLHIGLIIFCILVGYYLIFIHNKLVEKDWTNKDKWWINPFRFYKNKKQFKRFYVYLGLMSWVLAIHVSYLLYRILTYDK